MVVLAGAADRRAAPLPDELDGEAADAAGRGVHEHGVPGADPQFGQGDVGGLSDGREDPATSHDSSGGFTVIWSAPTASSSVPD